MKLKAKRHTGGFISIAPLVKDEEIKLVVLKKYQEKQVRRFLRLLTGAPERCKVVHTQTDIFRYYIGQDVYPVYSGSPPSWSFPDFTKCDPPIWFIKNGKRTYRPWPTPTYIPSTQRVEIGINHLNHIKLFFKEQKKSKYKMEIEGRIIDLPNLKLGRYLWKHHPNKDKVKIIK